MKKIISYILIITTMLLISGCNSDEDSTNFSFKKPDYIAATSKIVFIGNSQISYNNSPDEFLSIAEDNGKNVSVESLTIDGSGLKQHCEAIRANDEGQQELLKQADVVVFHDYWLDCQSQEQINEIKSYCKKDVKMYFYLTHYNSGIYADVWKYSSKDWKANMKINGEELAKKSPYDAWKRYINDKATDDDIELLSKNIFYSPYEAYKNMDLSYVPEGFTFDRLIFNYDMCLEDLIVSTDYIHPSSLMAYIDGLVIYRTLFGKVKADSGVINVYCEGNKEKTKKVTSIVDKAVEESYNEFFEGTAKVLKFKSENKYVGLKELFG